MVLWDGGCWMSLLLTRLPFTRKEGQRDFTPLFFPLSLHLPDMSIQCIGKVPLIRTAGGYQLELQLDALQESDPRACFNMNMTCYYHPRNSSRRASSSLSITVIIIQYHRLT